MNRSNAQYRRQKSKYLEDRKVWFEQWICTSCGNYTQTPELDHIKRIGMGGGISTLDEENWQILCHTCHQRKDGGMRLTA